MTRFFTETFRYILLQYTSTSFWIKKNKTKDQSNVIITLTTLPSRVEGLKATLNSLTNQSLLPEKIILNLPKVSKREKVGYQIPSFLKDHPLVYINETEEDLGPATKLLPTLELYKNELDKQIIVLDDDQIYPKKLVENYIKYGKELPNSALTLCGWTLPKNFKHNDREQIFGAIVRLYRKDESISKPLQVDCLQGASSYAVKPKLFDQAVFDYSDAPKEAFFVDDIWFGGQLAKKGISVFIVPISSRFGRLRSIKQFYEESLSRKINTNGHNNDTLYQYFKSYWWSLNK